MNLKEKVYQIYDESSKIREDDNLRVVINSIRTNLTVKELFLSDRYNQQGSKIVGYSVLQYLDVENGFLVDGNRHKISFFNMRTNENLFIELVRNTFIQWNDKKIDAVKEKEYRDLLNKAHLESAEEIKTEEKSGVVAEPTPEPVKEPDSAEATSGKDEVKEEEKEEEKVEEEVEEKIEPTNKPVEELDDDAFSELKTQLLEEGYNEYTKDNLLFLFKAGEVPVLGIGKDGKFTEASLTLGEQSGKNGAIDYEFAWDDGAIKFTFDTTEEKITIND